MIEKDFPRQEQESQKFPYDVGFFYLPRQKEDGTDDQYCDSFFINVLQQEAGVFDAARHGFTQKWAGKLAKSSFMISLHMLNTQYENPTVRPVVESFKYGWESAENAIKRYHDKPNAKFKNHDAMDMATTATVMKIVETKSRKIAVVAHGGDTKFLAVYPDRTTKQTRDQSYIYHMEQTGKLTAAQATTIEDLISNGIDSANFKNYLVDKLGNYILPANEDQKALWVMRGAESIRTYWDRRQYLENCIYDNRLYTKPGEEKIGKPEFYRFDITSADFFMLYSDGIGDNFLQKNLINTVRSAIANGKSVAEITQYICHFSRKNASNPASYRAIRDDMTFILWIPKKRDTTNAT